MKSRSAFEFTVRKMLRDGGKLYFWTFTFKQVHSLKVAMGLWNQFLTLLKRKLGFRGVRVLELHEEHGCHFHVVTNQRFNVRKILAFSARYGFGRLHVRPVSEPAKAVKYLCKYLSKARPGCLKGARLWSAFGEIERTRVKDVLSDTPMVRILRRVMGKRSVEAELAGVEEAPPGPNRFGSEENFQKALEKAWLVYWSSFDLDFCGRQARWQQLKAVGMVSLSTRWMGTLPPFG